MAASEPMICIIDDDEVVRDSLSALLQSRNLKVAEFESCDAFLARKPSVTAVCLVLDVHMPGMTGLELLHLLRKQDDRVPVILITGRRDPSVQSQATALGVVALLDKPVAHPKLFAAIQQAQGQTQPN
jgi:FixJ family two-component response regulator